MTTDEDFTDILGGEEDVMFGINADTAMTPEAIFVDEYVRSGNAFLACGKSGLFEPNYPMEISARRVLSRPEIQAAIAIAKKNPPKPVSGLYSREMLIEELQRTHESALADRQYGPAISAVKLQAGMLGYLETTVNINHNVTAKELSLADLRRMVSERYRSEDALNVTPSVIEGHARLIEGDGG